MEKQITFVYSYYENPKMFQLHQKNWMEYDEKIKDHVSFIVTDDCSQKYPAKQYVLPNIDIDLKIFRNSVDIKWNWEGARNIGAHETTTKWIFVTDMDLLVPYETAKYLVDNISNFDDYTFYNFDRIMVSNKEKIKPHVNTYFLTKKLYWDSGGYDEEVNILSGGMWGNDGPFKRWIRRTAKDEVQLSGVNLLCYSTTDISDSACDFLGRKETRDKNICDKMKSLSKHKFQNNIRAKVLQFPYTREL